MTNKKTDTADNKELISIDHRLKNVEHIANTVDNVAEKALESWSHYLEQKNEQEKRETENHNIQHKRASQILMVSIILVFILLIVSIVKDQYDLVKIILGSALSLAAGAGLSNVFKTKK